MAVYWKGRMKCPWCQESARAGIEKDGLGKTFRVICDTCGLNAQVGLRTPAGRKVQYALHSANHPIPAASPTVPPGTSK